MAVGKKTKKEELSKPVLIRDYWPWFKRQIISMLILPPLLSAVIIGSVLLLTQTFVYTSPLFWAICVGIALLGIASSILLFLYASKPTKDLLSALVYVAGEPSGQPAPNPNEAHYQTNGFRQALQTIYSLASGKADGKDLSKTASKTNDITKALDQAQSGFVALDDNRKVVYASKSTPLHTVNNELQLRLLFNGGDSLGAWLDECEHEAVHAERIWTRIPDGPADTEGRRIFDVMASYEKGALYETVITLVDRTKSYQIDEEDLNFIAFAAHELRGPITVIRGYLDVLHDELGDVLQDDQHELFRRLVVSASRLSGYINNILNTSRYDRRHLNINLVEDSVQGVYDTISDDMAMRASAQNRLLSVQFPTDLPTIAADRGSLSEVFGNLIDNAVKYSNEGGAISVTADVKGDFVEVIVEDHGIGMPGNVISNLFQKFYRSHRSRETVAGSGIGLYISKAIVESHGGTISVRSAEGVGSVFTVSLPVYATVADKLQSGNNKGLISQGNGWIKNHSMYRG